MRYIRTILDVICYHDKRHISSTSSQSPIQSPLIFDVARLKNETLVYDEEYLSDEARRYFDDYADTLQRIKNGIVRLHLPSGSCSGFYIGLGLIATNKHNFTQINPSSAFINTNDIYSTPSLLKQCTVVTNDDSDFCYARTNIARLNLVESKLFDPNIYSDLSEVHVEKDPILGITGDFDMIDFVVIKETEKISRNNRVIFVPSIEHVQINDPIITISYPGNENSTQKSSGRINYDAFLPSYEDLRKIFYGFGGRCVSYGRVIAPYRLNEDSALWIEDLEYRNKDFLHYQCILSNENLYHGSSGGVTLKANFDLDQNILTKTGEKITLVQFISIHFGGQFNPCCDCLSNVTPSNRMHIGPDDIQNLHECKACDRHERTPVAYNYGVSVHHPAFKEYYRLYKQYYVDLFGGKLPNLLNAYYELHQI